MTARHSAPPRALNFANRPSFRANLLSRASLAAVLAGTAASPRAIAGGTHLGMQQALASASAAAARVTGNAASIAAGKQAQLGIANLQTAVKSMQQALARQKTVTTGTAATSFNGLGANALQAVSACQIAAGACTESAATAQAMIQGPSNAGGTVTITQTAPEAVITWSSFNVGAKTHLVFNQSAGGAAATSWSVLNRISGGTSPSEIFGSISAPGQVLILNPNGVLFGNGAQVNLHSLVAGAISLTDAQYASSGIYGTFSLNSKVEANSFVTVQPGALIATPAPQDASDGGGSVLLIAGTVDNAGTIETPAGQTILSGGGTFTTRTGFSVPANTTVTPGVCGGEAECSTVLGTEIDASGAGTATNTGYIAATTGDITLDARTVTQGGILYATTSVSRRGTIHLLSETTDTKSSITLAPGSLTYIAPDPNSLTADNSQRDDTPRTAYGGTGGYADQAYTTDYPDRSRIEITTGGLVNVQTNALVLANGGQVAISTEPNGSTAPTQGRVFMASGADIDVSGLNNIIEPMSANVFSVNIQGVTLADAPLNREAESLFNSTISLDDRHVIYVAPSTVDPNARDYTAGGLFEVSGELSQIEQSIAEWSAIGGNVTIHSGAVVAQPGSVVNIAGGTIVYQAGSVPQTYLIGPGGVLYNANIAPANLLYSGVYDGDVIVHKRWHTTDSYTNALLTPASIQEPAYIEGRDAGTLTLATPTAVFEATINAGVQTGPYQTVAHNTVASATAYTDPVTINQNVAPEAGSLVFADVYFPGDISSTQFQTNVTIAAQTQSVAGSLTAESKITGALANTAVFGASQLDGLGGLTIITGTDNAKKINIGSIDVEGAVTLAPGGTVTLASPAVTLDAALTARSGAVTLETTNPILTSGLFPGTNRGRLIVTATGSIDTRGLWTNLFLDPADSSGAAFINGGNIALISTGTLSLAAGSLLDASAGAIATSATSITGGKGGNITVVADDPALLGVKSATDTIADPLAPAIIDGTVRALGVSAGGTFSLTVPSIAIGNGLTPASDLQAVLSPSFFLGGFSAYILNGFYTPTGALGAAGTAQGVVVEPGTSITVAEPLLEATQSALLSPTGTDPSVPLMPILNPEFVLNPATGGFSRRAGASLTLDSYLAAAPVPLVTGSGITIGQGASITVDTGQSVTLESPAQITVSGTIAAPSGTIAILNNGVDNGNAGSPGPVEAAKLSIWIGQTAVLDTSGLAVTGLNAQGEPVGEVFAGGTIVLGGAASATLGNDGSINDLTSTASAAAYIFVRPGAELLANGAAAELDLSAGTYGSSTAPAGQTQQAALTDVASAGGTIAFASDLGIYLQGAMQAKSGGPNAAGGELAIRLGDPGFAQPSGTTTLAYPAWVDAPHEILVSQTTLAAPQLDNLTPGDSDFAKTSVNGQAAISVAQIDAGGFGSALLLAHDQVEFDGSVSLKLPQSLTIADFTTSDTSKSGAVSLAAPYVLLAGYFGANLDFEVEGSSGNGQGAFTVTPAIAPSDGVPYSKVSPCISGLASCYDASLTVTASLIDLEGNVEASGAYGKFQLGTTSSGTPIYRPTLDTDGFNTLNLVSSGDIRFISCSYCGTSSQNINGIFLQDDGLTSEGNINLTAARIYPATGVNAFAVAGLNYWTNKDAGQHNFVDSTLYYGGSLVINRSTTSPQSTPLSVFGDIGFDAATILQDGNVYAPLGVIGFGQASGVFSLPRNSGTLAYEDNYVLSVTLGAGSTTSVSANGLTVPFGGTTDGTAYEYAGQALSLAAASLGAAANNDLPGIDFDAPVSTVQAGATLDLAGGGTLTGGTGEVLSGGTLTSQGFISGRGGSTDTLVTPFISFNAKTLSVTQPTLTQDPIFAIVPSFTAAYAPVAELDTPGTAAGVSYYGSLPQIGEQITIAKSVDGLAAGTYTLLPSYYALLPGAYRVQIVASSVAGASPALTGTSLALGNGTVETTGNLGTANTGVYNVTPDAIYLTSAATVRTYSQYDEENYATFGAESAAVFGNPRPFLPQDAGALLVSINQLRELKKKKGTLTTISVNGTGSGFNFDGTALLSAGSGGYGGELVVVPVNQTNLEILAPGGNPAAKAVGVSASAIDAVNAPVVLIGNVFGKASFGSSSAEGNAATVVTVDSGATLSAGALFLLGSKGITIDAGATLTTIGDTVSVPDSDQGVLFSAGSVSVLGLANGNFLFAPVSSSGGTAPIQIGACPVASGCAGATTALLSDGFLGVIANGSLTVAPNVVFGARDLQLDAGLLDIGTPSTSGTSGSGTASGGVTLTQALLSQLIAGDSVLGVPALQTLSLSAATAIDFGSGASLNTINPVTGTSTLGELDIATPEFLGDNASGGATITTGTLVWNGIAGASATAAIQSGFGNGSGTLKIDAADILIGYPAQSQAQNTLTLGHLISGFGTVMLDASSAFSANNKASLTVYQCVQAACQGSSGGSATASSGGTLDIASPVVTTANGAILGITAGGDIDLSGAGASPASSSLGGEIDLTAGGGVSIDTRIALESGKFVANATGDIVLDAGAVLDLSGPSVKFFTQSRGSFGGTAELISQNGNITLSGAETLSNNTLVPAATIDLAATDNNAGTLTMIARGGAPGEGTISLAGTVLSSATGTYDAGSVAITASSFGGDSAFQSLTSMLTSGGATYAQTFEQVGGGTLSVGNITAQNVSVSVDGGSLSSLVVTGTIDASGLNPGSIALASTGNLTLAPGAVLNVQETTLHEDQLGELIVAENQPHIELQVASGTAGVPGTLTIGQGVTIAMGGPGGLALGDLEIDAPRSGAAGANVNVSAAGSLDISGAATIAVNAFKTYTPGDGYVTSDGTITQATLDAINADSLAFMNAAIGINGTGTILGTLTAPFASELAGLAAYSDVFHLRPGVEIDSLPDGDLTITGALNLADFRYNTVNPAVGDQANALSYGGGEPGVLWLRAANDLDINGDISDGFAAPPTVVFQGKHATTTLTNLWSLSAMLAAGDLSWSMRLVAGADLDAADSRTVLPPDVGVSAASNGGGAISLDDVEVLPTFPYFHGNINYQSLNVDVIRTGTGYLDLFAGGNFVENSPFGIYTSGTETSDANAPVVAANTNGAGSGGKYFPENGGDLTASFGGTAQGFDYYASSDSFSQGFVTIDSVTYDVEGLNSWLGVGKTANGSTGWWVDFGHLLQTRGAYVPILYAVNGFATLGGGNLSLATGGDAGNVSANGSGNITTTKKAIFFISASGLNVTVGSTGYQYGGTETTLGGGDLAMDIGGALNPVSPTGYVKYAGEPYTFALTSSLQTAFGEISNLRGSTTLEAASIGQIDLSYSALNTSSDPRPLDPFVAESYEVDATVGGPVLIVGDSQATVQTRGDLVLADVSDGLGLVKSFYQPETAVDLFSAGGNVVPTTVNTIDPDNVSNETEASDWGNTVTFVYSPIFDAIAASGNIYLSGGDSISTPIILELAPSQYGSLSLLAGKSIYDGGSNLSQPAPQLRLAVSGAGTTAPSEVPGLLFPVQDFSEFKQGVTESSYVFEDATGLATPAGDRSSRFYAVSGDIVGLLSGLIDTAPNSAQTEYIAGGPVQIIAGGDVVSTGEPTYSNAGGQQPTFGGPDLFINTTPTDISLIQAGKDIIWANADVAGPGQLMVMAGGNVYQGSDTNGGVQQTGILLSLGQFGASLTPTTRESGAGITVLAGLDGGFNPTGFADLYLNPANLANSTTPLQDQKGKVERTYLTQLVTWLQARGYAGTAQDALAYFLGLPAYEQTSFLLNVYYAELNQSGLDYNTTNSRFYHSYAEGQEAIAALFPNTDPTGQSAADGGSLTLFSGTYNRDDYDSAIRTEFGGAIQTIVPYGQTLLGNYGIVPQATAGILTQGSGDIDMYSYGSVTLGQSRVLTTYGGNVLIWMSSDGEINAGRGSKTTALTPPPNISYDPYGNIFLSPTVPSSGAGIGALAPIAGIPAGDVNLIAPVGTVDLGEAGVRASGNLNLAALVVVNLANASVGGKTTGAPTVAGPSVAATAAASAAAASSQSATQNTLQRPAQQQPSIIEVEVLAGGVASESEEERRKKRPRA